MTINYTTEAVDLLRQLIATPSVSREEHAAADIMAHTIRSYGMDCQREANNIWSIAEGYDPDRPTLLLNAHIDTVKPVTTWKRDPFQPTLEDGILYGLGSNDCGGGLTTLLQVYRHLSSHRQSYNLIYLATAEEEVSGADGARRVLPLLPKIDVAIVGEPTGMQPAIAERGLMVIDMTSRGKSGHAARGEGVNAINAMLDDLMWLRDYRFERESPLLGPTRMNVTMVNAGTQHNVIPDTCHAVIDVRTNEFYDNEAVFRFIREHVRSEVRARSFHLRSSHIAESHPLIQRCIAMGMKPFGSPTLSDQSLMPFASFKLGPGDSSRSHTADEFILVSEMENAITQYIRLLDGVTF